MITREDYMKDSSNLHRAFYAQFVNDGVKQRILNKWTVKQLKKAHQEDEHFNNLPMKVWDLMGGFVWRVIRGEQIATMQPRTAADILPVNATLLKEAGEGVSNSTMVCVYKEAAREIIEENHE